MKLSRWAKSVGIGYQAAWNMFKMKQIPGAYQLPTGTVVIPENIDQLLREASDKQQEAAGLAKIQHLLKKNEKENFGRLGLFNLQEECVDKAVGESSQGKT